MSTGRSDPKKRPHYLGAHDFHTLNQACRMIAEAYGYPYLVGSCLERPDFRDVDVRCILDDDEFARLFPGTHGEADILQEHSARLSLLNASITLYLSRMTGLPIDFQFQQQTRANDKYPGKRNALGIYISAPIDSEAPR